MKSLDQYFSGEPELEPQPGSADSEPDPEAPRKLQQLCILLDEHNADAEDYLLEVRASLASILPLTTIEQLATHLGQYEFEEARSLLP